MKSAKLAASAAAAAAVVLALSATGALAQSSNSQSSAAAAGTPSATSANETRNATKHVSDAMAELRVMESDPHVKDLLRQSKGVFLVPDYGRAALGVGGQGGAGALLVHSHARWEGPAFYNFGGASIGLEAGAAGGQTALILMDDKALQAFGQANTFALNADAGLTIVDWSARAHGSAGHGDIVAWSRTKGLFGNASISVTDINFDRSETAAYYGHAVTPGDVVAGLATSSRASRLLHMLPA